MTDFDVDDDDQYDCVYLFSCVIICSTVLATHT